MDERHRRLQELERLAELRRTVETGRLERLRASIRALEAQIDALEEATLRGYDTEFAPTPYQLSGRAVSWEAWRTLRARDLSMQIARLKAEEQAQMRLARVAIGTHLVVGKLRERSKT